MVDGHHSAATGYNLRYSQSGAGTWTTGSGVNSPCSITGLSGAAGADVEVQHASSIASASSAITTGTTRIPDRRRCAGPWHRPGAGRWCEPHRNTRSDRGCRCCHCLVRDPTLRPTTNLVTASSDGQTTATNGWGQYFNALYRWHLLFMDARAKCGWCWLAALPSRSRCHSDRGLRYSRTGRSRQSRLLSAPTGGEGQTWNRWRGSP